MNEDASSVPASAIDWAAVRRRLETAQTALERGWKPAPEEKKRILKARARALAREPERREAAGEYLEVVTFMLAYEQYGIESSCVREVYPLRELTLVPCTPPFVLGILNVRGQILSVTDIKKFFDLPEKGLTDLNKVIILHAPEMELGILADTILGVSSIPLADIQPPPPTLTGIRAEYLKGVTKKGLILLDAAEMLADKRIVVHEEVEM